MQPATISHAAMTFAKRESCGGVPVQPAALPVGARIPGTRFIVFRPPSYLRFPSNGRVSIRIRSAIRVFGLLWGHLRLVSFPTAMHRRDTYRLIVGFPVGVDVSDVAGSWVHFSC